jgi:predicted nucleotidyltransferase
MGLMRPAVLDDVMEAVTQWAKELARNGMAQRGYIFGSTVNQDGMQFDPRISDIDVFLVVEWDDSDFLGRVRRLNELTEQKLVLEQQLLHLLKRANADKAIVSLVALSPWERDEGVHKDGHRAIMDNTPALDLNSGKLCNRISSDGIERRLSELHRTTLQFIQKQRAAFLNLSANGSTSLKIAAHDDPAPKELLRNFAVATADSGAPGPAQTDVSRGLEELTLFLNKPEILDPTYRAFSKWLAVKRGARGHVNPIISEEHYLIALEAIYDIIRIQYPSTTVVSLKSENSIRAPQSRQPLKAQFTISKSDKLAGRETDLAAEVKKARANLEAQAEPAFSVTFEEDSEAIKLLADDTEIKPEDEDRRVSAFRRRTEVERRQPRLEASFRLILYYGGTLFRANEHQRIKALVKSLKSMVEHNRTGVVNIGGMWEARHCALYPELPLAFSFSANINFDWDLRPASTLSPDELARSFVPELTSKYLHLCRSARESIEPHVHSIFDVHQWEFGPK